MTQMPEQIDPNVARLQGVEAGARVVVAMSGGVDFSVAAALLKSAGYDVVGVTLQLYDGGGAAARSGSCCAGLDIRDARRVADALGIPHYVFDYEARFRAQVIERFADSYIAGETPIPCVACNQTVKFTDLLGAARELGAAALATGHYVDWRFGPEGPELYRGADVDRDQSYFLFATTREQLAYLRFPLGALKKQQVRALAAQYHLPVAQKADSQDICFVPTGRYADVIERLRPGAAEPGEIVSVDGRVLGQHPGIIHFTVGQRRGLGIAHSEPLYVVRIDASARRVVVGPRAELETNALRLRDFNWLGREGADPVWPADRRLFARVRSTQPPREATLLAKAGIKSILLRDAELGVAVGQACVLYSAASHQARLLGGGYISTVEKLSTRETCHGWGQQPDPRDPIQTRLMS